MRKIADKVSNYNRQRKYNFFVNYFEPTIYSKILEKALRRIKLIQSLAVRIVESDENLNLMAGKLKTTNTISLADAYRAAVCQECAGILVHKDPEFEKMSPLIKGYKLPYKTA